MKSCDDGYPSCRQAEATGKFCSGKCVATKSNEPGPIMTNTKSQSPAPGVAAERQRFEATFAKLSPGCDFSRASNDTYANRYVEHNWQGWSAALQARAAAVSIPVAEVAAGNLGPRLMWHTSDAQELTPVGTLLYSGPPAETQEPVMTIGFDESEKCRSLPFGMKLYAHPPLPAQVQAADWTPEMIAAFKAAFKEGSIWEDRVTAGIKAALASRTPAPGMAGGVGALNPAEVQAIVDLLKPDHDGSDFEAECPSCTAYRKLTAPHPSPAPQAGLPLTQESKYTISGNSIVNRASGEAIPPDEPIFIFRARDRQACSILGEYAQLCENAAHREAVNERFIQFGEWADANPHRMKEPDTAAIGSAGAVTAIRQDGEPS